LFSVRAGKKGEKSKIKATDIGLVDTQLEEGDLHSLFSDNKQLIDDDSDLDAQEYKTANTQQMPYYLNHSLIKHFPVMCLLHHLHSNLTSYLHPFVPSQ
jgi:hypothetical protein